MPKASFILPAYKRRFLKESIDSILAQTYRDFELVIVDDKSPEGLYEIIKEYKWEPTFEALPDGGQKWLVDGIPVRYYQNAENLGGKDLVAAWNHAMEYATGEWCVLASDDDVYMPEYLEEMMRLHVKYPQSDLIHCRIVAIGGGGETQWIGWPRAEFENGIAMIYHATVMRLEQRMGDLMFRKEALMKLGGIPYNPTAWYTDLMTAVILSQKNGAVCSSRILYKFRVSGENISSRYDDVAVKIEAGLQFKDWIWRVIASSSKISIDDDYLLEQIYKHENRCIYDVMWRYLSQLGFWRMSAVLNKSRLDRPFKIQFLRMKISMMLTVKSILRVLFYPIVIVIRSLRQAINANG